MEPMQTGAVSIDSPNLSQIADKLRHLRNEKENLHFQLSKISNIKYRQKFQHRLKEIENQEKALNEKL